MIALERIADLKRLLAMRWSRLTVWREGNSHLRDGMCVGVSRVKGLEVPWHDAENRPRDPHDVYMRDEDADLVVAAITTLPEIMAELERLNAVARAAQLLVEAYPELNAHVRTLQSALTELRASR